ncbi:MAG: hypothetical protein HRU71_09245 [Planctomycetia bacterium]|nr:MAG: hypothetical protein HRU71_09245 [Planctomycetia bacterium]
MEYRCVATSVAGFVQQLAVAYITHGYWFYVAGEIPEGKDPDAIDAKLIDRYGIAMSKWARCRRKKQGLANMQYLRHERFFVLLATKGWHEFFERENASIRDVRRAPIKFASYSIGCRKGRDGQWHASVRISPDRYEEIRRVAVSAVSRGDVVAVDTMIRSFMFPRCATIRRQLAQLVTTVNRHRRIAGREIISTIHQVGVN